jgi:hypothetical protein
MTDKPAPPLDLEEPELYVEPPRLGAKDITGIILALVALGVIGFSGYVWLNPDMSLTQLLAHRPAATAPVSPATSTADAAGTATDSANSGSSTAPPVPDMNPETGSAAAETSHQSAPVAGAGKTTAAAGNNPAATSPAADRAPTAVPSNDCPYCGMFADKSLSHIIAKWSDGSATQHDSWDCTFSYGKQQGLTLASAQVLDYASHRMLDAAGAFYLHDTTEKITGSMPPFTAAFPDRADAEAAQSGLGGEVVDFAGLKSKWD